MDENGTKENGPGKKGMTKMELNLKHTIKCILQ
jgi:hypothetical protein